MMNTEQLLAYFLEVIEEIFASVLSAEDLLNDKNKMALLQSIFEALDRLGVAVEEVIPVETARAYFGGVDEATALLTNAGVSVAEAGALTLTAGGQIATGVVQRRIHLEAVDAIAGDTMMDMKAAIRTAKNSAVTTIDEALAEVKGAIAKGIIKGEHSKVAAQKVAQAFAKHGLTAFVTSDGKKLPLDFYARTVTRTKTRTAHTTGAVNRYKETGVKFVKINEHHPTCHVCARYQGMVVALEENEYGFPTTDGIPLPPYHPNCQHTVSPYVIEFKTEAEIQEEKKKWEQFNPEKDVRTTAQRQAYEKEQAIRREANQEKKNYAKMLAALGDKAPKTIGAYRRMKRKNDEKWKQLQSEYLSAVRQI